MWHPDKEKKEKVIQFVKKELKPFLLADDSIPFVVHKRVQKATRLLQIINRFFKLWGS